MRERVNVFVAGRRLPWHLSSREKRHKIRRKVLAILILFSIVGHRMEIIQDSTIQIGLRSMRVGHAQTLDDLGLEKSSLLGV